MFNKVFEGKIDKIVEKFVETRRNQDNDNNNTVCIRLKFISFASTIDQAI